MFTLYLERSSCVNEGRCKFGKNIEGIAGPHVEVCKIIRPVSIELTLLIAKYILFYHFHEKRTRTGQGYISTARVAA